jgi:amidohydrolase
MIFNLKQRADDLFYYSQQICRDIHSHPELGFREYRTAGVVARELASLGLEMTTGVAETGVVAMLEGIYPGPVLLLRFDMDALPIHEETGVDYASQNPGIMHACGHDSHVAIGLTVAKMLSEVRDQIHGSIKFVFQPAEEGMGGAERMLEAGSLSSPNVDYSLAMHVWNEKPVGWMGIVPGPLMAGADLFEVRIEGKGGHGALPQETIDPVIASAQILSSLQTIVSRNISPFDAAVISVCQIRAGNAFNVIPQHAEFSGTFRTFHPDVRQRLVERFSRLVNEMAGSLGCKADITVKKMTSPVINDKAITGRVREVVT